MLFLLAASCDALRLPTGIRSRRAVVSAAAAAAAATNFQPAAAETISEICVNFNKNMKANTDVYWESNKPVFTPNDKLTTMTSFAFAFTVPSDSGVEYLWLRRYLPNAPADLPPRVISPNRVPDASKGLYFALPKGSYIACAYSPTHGLWESQPFIVGANK